MDSNNNLIIRRAVAVILMILTIVFLFWPAFVKLRAYGVSAEISLSKFRQFLGELSDYGLSVSFMNVITNIAFFGMIGLAAISVIAMALGKSKAFTVLHTLLAILYALIALVDVGRGQIGTEEVPLSLGASLFLIPIFSLAVSIVYQEGDRQWLTDFGGTAQSGNKPTDNPWLGWTCAKCGTNNETKAQFCQHCGTQKPIPNTGKWVCPHCHESNSSSALFCMSSISA